MGINEVTKRNSKENRTVRTLTVYFVGTLLLIVPIAGEKLRGLIWLGVADSEISTRVVVFSLPFLLLAIPTHEALHALGFMKFGHAKLTDLHFGVSWKRLFAWCHCPLAVPARGYLLTLLLPLLILGLIPMAVGILFNSPMCVFVGGVMVAASAGDIAVSFLVLRLGRDELVMDSLNDVGFTVVKGDTSDSGASGADAQGLGQEKV